MQDSAASKQHASTGRTGGVGTSRMIPIGELTVSHPDRVPPNNELAASNPIQTAGDHALNLFPLGQVRGKDRKSKAGHIYAVMVAQ